MRVLLTFLIAVMLAGCATTQEGAYVEYDSAGNVIAQYTGSAMGAAAIGVSRRQAKSEPVQWDCNAASTAAGQQACYQTAMMATVVQAIGGGPQEQSDVQSLVAADATRYAADRAFYSNIIGASISGGTSLLSQAIVASTQRKRDAEMFGTFRTFAENGGVRSYAFEEAEVGGDFNFSEIGRDGNLAGNDIGQSTVDGGLIGRDSIPTEGDGVVGGQPTVTSGEAPAEISPSDPDDTQSDVGLF